MTDARAANVIGLRRDNFVAHVSFADFGRANIQVLEKTLRERLVIGSSVLVQDGAIVEITSTPSLVKKTGIVRIVQNNDRGNQYGLISVGETRDIYLHTRALTQDQAASFALGAIIEFEINPNDPKPEALRVNSISLTSHRAMKVTRASEGTNARLFLCSSPHLFSKLDLAAASTLFADAPIGTIFNITLVNKNTSKGLRLKAEVTGISSTPDRELESELIEDQSPYRERLLSLMALGFASDHSLVLRLIDRLSSVELRSVIVGTLLESCADSAIWNAFLPRFVSSGFPRYRGGFWPVAIEQGGTNSIKAGTLDAYLALDLPIDHGAFARLIAACRIHGELLDRLIGYCTTPSRQANRPVEDVVVLLISIADAGDDKRFVHLVNRVSAENFCRQLSREACSALIGAIAGGASELIQNEGGGTDLIEICNNAFPSIGQCLEWRCFGSLARFYGSYRDAERLKALMDLWPTMPNVPNWKSFGSLINAAMSLEDGALVHEVVERSLAFGPDKENKDFVRFALTAAEQTLSCGLPEDALRVILIALECDISIKERINAVAVLWSCSELLGYESKVAQAEIAADNARQHLEKLLQLSLTEDELLSVFNCALVHAPKDSEALPAGQQPPAFSESIRVYSRLTDTQQRALRNRKVHSSYVQDLRKRDEPSEKQAEEISNYIEAADRLHVSHVAESNLLALTAARLNRKLGNFAEAGRLLERSIRMNRVQGAAQIAYEQGMLCWAQEDIEGAEAKFRESVRMREHAASIHMLAKVLVQKGSVDEAIEVLALNKSTEDKWPLQSKETLANAYWKRWQATGNEDAARTSCALLCEIALLESSHAQSDKTIAELCVRLPDRFAGDALLQILDQCASGTTIRSLGRWERSLRKSVPEVLTAVKRKWLRDRDDLLAAGAHIDLARLAMQSAINLYFEDGNFVAEISEFFRDISPWKIDADREFLFECLVAQRGDVLKRMLRQYSLECEKLFAPILLDDDHALEVILSEPFNERVRDLLERKVPLSAWPENFKDRRIWSERDLLDRLEGDVLVALRSSSPALSRSTQSVGSNDRFISFADLTAVQDNLRRLFGADSELVEFLGSIGLPTALAFKFDDATLEVRCDWLLVEELEFAELERRVRSLLEQLRLGEKFGCDLEQGESDRVFINVRFEFDRVESHFKPFDPLLSHLFQATRVFLREGAGQSFFRDARASYDACLQACGEPLPSVEWSKVYHEVLDQEMAANADWLFRGESGSAHPRGAIHVLKNEIDIIQRGKSHPDLLKNLAKLRKSIGNLQKSIIRISRYELDLVKDKAATDIFGVLSEIVSQHSEINFSHEQGVNWVLGDQLVVERVLANLVGNAIRHANQLVPPGRIDLSLARSSGLISIEIKNEFALDGRNVGGTGIGLVDVANLVQNALEGEFSWSIAGSVFTARMTLQDP